MSYSEDYDEFSLADFNEPEPEFRNLEGQFYLDSDQDTDDEEELGEEGEEEVETEEQEPDSVIGTGGTRIRVFEDPDNRNEPAFEMLTRSKKLREDTKWDHEVVAFLNQLQNLTAKYLQMRDLPIFTLHRRDNNMFHGHPNYRCHGPWRDWALVDWGTGYGILPTHIWCFVELENMPTGAQRIEYGGVYLDNNVYAVVEAAEYDDPEDNHRLTDIFTPLTKEVGHTNAAGEVLERQFYLADVEAIVGPCIVIPDIGGACECLFPSEATE